jgi:hypothetical protein
VSVRRPKNRRSFIGRRRWRVGPRGHSYVGAGSAASSASLSL